MDDRLREIETHIDAAWNDYDPENSIVVFADAKWLVKQLRETRERAERIEALRDFWRDLFFKWHPEEASREVTLLEARHE